MWLAGLGTRFQKRCSKGLRSNGLKLYFLKFLGVYLLDRSTETVAVEHCSGLGLNHTSACASSTRLSGEHPLAGTHPSRYTPDADVRWFLTKYSRYILLTF